MFWIGWDLPLIAQNFAFTFVSRARNSASLTRHIVAAQLSNGVWFVGQLFAMNQIISILKGEQGIGMAVFTGIFYTVFTTSGSVLSHWWSLKTEKGKARVGATA